MKNTSKHYFTHGDFGYYAAWNDPEEIFWDGDGVEEPTDGDYEDALEYWAIEGLSEDIKDSREDEADNRYNRMREDA